MSNKLRSNNNMSKTNLSDSKPPRKWLYDRINGVSKAGYAIGKSRPPLRMCMVPPFVGWCPGCMEDNAFCRLYGSFGVIPHDFEYTRVWMLKVGLFVNLVAFLLTIAACAAISDEYDVLRKAGYSSGVVTGDGAFLPAEEISIEVGLTAAAVLVPGVEAPFVVPFADFCDTRKDGLGFFLNTTSESCNDCHEASSGMVVSIILAAIAFVPTFSIDVLRMYANYDINCQKFFSTVLATLSMVLMMNTLVRYNNDCVAALYDGTVTLDANGEPVDDVNGAAVSFVWELGPGLLCLYIGTFLKVLNVFVNLVVPTPEITRNRELQWEYQQREGIEETEEFDEESDQMVMKR